MQAQFDVVAVVVVVVRTANHLNSPNKEEQVCEQI